MDYTRLECLKLAVELWKTESGVTAGTVTDYAERFEEWVHRDKEQPADTPGDSCAPF